jgi:hypothetical protein
LDELSLAVVVLMLMLMLMLMLLMLMLMLMLIVMVRSSVHGQSRVGRYRVGRTIHARREIGLEPGLEWLECLELLGQLVHGRVALLMNDLLLLLLLGMEVLHMLWLAHVG